MDPLRAKKTSRHFMQLCRKKSAVLQRWGH
jgi:hypothetical protein